MGEVSKPSDILGKKKPRIPDLPSTSVIVTPGELARLIEEVRSIKLEIHRIKEALKRQGIEV